MKNAFKNALTFEETKKVPTYTLKVLTNLLASLDVNLARKATSKFSLLIETRDDILEIPFDSEIDASYSKRKFKKILRLSFKDEFRLSIVELA